MKIVFFGTSNVALPVLDSLHSHHDIAAVVTQPDAPVGRKRELTESPVSLLAGELGIKILKPEKVKGNDLFRMELQDIAADLFVVVSYGKILPKEIIDMPPYKTLNVHFSLLPKYRGASPLQFALLNGDTQTGTSIFVLDEQVDHGPVLVAQGFPVDPDDNFITLSQRLAYASAALLKDNLHAYVSGSLIPVPQNEAGATVTKIISKADGRVDWNKPAPSIYNQFRAFYPWPGIWTVWNGKTVKILDCVPLSEGVVESPGTVLSGGVVACGDGTALKIKMLQIEGKNETPFADFVNGYPNFIGCLLGQ